jgi:hypothetical protein
MAFDVEKESSRRGIDEDTTAWSAISDMKKKASPCFFWLKLNRDLQEEGRDQGLYSP